MAPEYHTSRAHANGSLKFTHISTLHKADVTNRSLFLASSLLCYDNCSARTVQVQVNTKHEQMLARLHFEKSKTTKAVRTIALFYQQKQSSRVPVAISSQSLT